METVQLGESGPLVSRLGLGTMMMGWRMGATEAVEVLAAALDHGVTLVDSSVSYGRGQSHSILGDAIRKLGNRNHIFLATKVGGISCDGDPEQNIGISEYNIVRQCHLSLEQLNVDYIDLLQLHLSSDTVSVDEQLGALEFLRQKGYIRYYGVCNHNKAQIDRLCTAAKRLSITGLVSHQFGYNLLEQNCGKELLTQCGELGLGNIIWGPLCSGLLTDHYGRSTRIKAQSRIEVGRERCSKMDLLMQPETQVILKGLAIKSQFIGRSIQQQAVDWLLNNGEVGSVLLGPSSLSQFLDILPRSSVA